MSEFQYYQYKYQIPYNSSIIFFIKQDKIANQIVEIISWNEFKKEKIFYSESLPFFVLMRNEYIEIAESDYKEIYGK